MTTTPAPRIPKLFQPTDNDASPPLNLYQKLAKISKEVSIRATGRTAQGATTMSISDVEKSLGDLLAAEGIVTDYHWNDDTRIMDTQGNAKLWLADITIRLTNSDAPDDHREARSIDVGTSPSAAVSFALKRFYRALFHLADEEDETRATGSGAAKSNPKSSAHLPAEQLAQLWTLNQQCPAPVPEGLAWDSLVAGRTFDAIKAMLEVRKKKQETDE